MSHAALSIPLARHLLDRDADARARPGLVDALLADDATRLIALRHGKALLTETVDGSTPTLARLRPGAVPSAEQYIYLGRSTDDGDAGTAILAALLSDEQASAVEPEELRWQGLRQAAPLLDDADAGLFGEVLAIANWHDSHGFCPRCGTATEPRLAGWVRYCPKDRIDIFPRTDPAVIVLITDDDDRVLLGSNASWQPGRFSLLAGFVEPGESLEHAVVREMKEEAGIDVVEPRYRGSQPWPFPASIMLGFTARLSPTAAPADLQPDGTEIIDLRWFTRDELGSAGPDVVLPGAASIARALLEDWYGGPIDDGEGRW
ncbi:MAG: NAD(+) diphosphatase [Leifsonia sp.]